MNGFIKLYKVCLIVVIGIRMLCSLIASIYMIINWKDTVGNFKLNHWTNNLANSLIPIIAISGFLTFLFSIKSLKIFYLSLKEINIQTENIKPDPFLIIGTYFYSSTWSILWLTILYIAKIEDGYYDPYVVLVVSIICLPSTCVLIDLFYTKKRLKEIKNRTPILGDFAKQQEESDFE